MQTQNISMWDRINHKEIELKLIDLAVRLRGNHGEHIRQAVAEYTSKRPTGKRARRLAAFVGAALSPQEIHGEGHVRAELSFLRDYILGVGKVYEEYFRRLDIPLTSNHLIEIWEYGIKPQWETFVEDFKQRIRIEMIDTPGKSDLVRRMTDKYQMGADQILKDVARTWRIKVEEAISGEMFGRQPTLSGQSLEREARAAKAVERRMRGSDYRYIYMRMWLWPEAGNRPADFIREHGDLLNGWLISKAQAFKMFNRVKK